MNEIRYLFLFLILFYGASAIHAQTDFKPLHSLSNYNYIIMGELDMEFNNVVNFKASATKIQSLYHIKTPIMLAFNLNDLKFFKAQPLQFLGETYDEVLLASTLYPYEKLEEAGSMKVDGHYHTWENGEHYEVKASAILHHFLEVKFNHASFNEKLKTGDKNLQFRLNISGRADEAIPQQEVKGYAKCGVMVLTEGFLLPISIGCGTFYGLDLVNALVTNNLVGDEKTIAIFEQQHEQEYFKNLPTIDALSLINFLIKPQGSYEVPFVGSFASDTENGSEKANYKGTLRLFANSVKQY